MYIPQLTGLFNPEPYKAPEDAMQNNLNTLGALQDPSGTLERLQSDQIIKGMADLKTEGISGLYSQHALNAIKGFQDYSKGLYKSRKGFNRLTLDGQQQLDESQKYRELLTNVNSLKELTTSYTTTLKQAATDVKNGIMTPEDYKAFEKELDAQNAAAKSIGDLPDAMAVYNNFITSKPEMMTLKKEMEFSNSMFGLYKQWNYTEGGTKGRNPQAVRQNIDNSHPPGSQQWAVLDAELTTRRFYPPGVTTEQQKKDFLAQASISGYNPREGSSTTNIYNESGGKDRYKPRAMQEGGYTYYNFSAKAVPDIYGNYSGKYTTVRVGADGRGEVFLSQIVNSSNEPIDVSADSTWQTMMKEGKAKRDPNKAGGVWVPYTDAVEGSLQMGNIDTKDIKVKKSGSYTAPGSDIKPTKLSGQIDKSTLVKDKEYNVNDKIYIWNGTKLVSK